MPSADKNSDATFNRALGASANRVNESLGVKYDSPDGGLRAIRARNGVNVDGPPDIRPEFAAEVKRRR